MWWCIMREFKNILTCLLYTSDRDDLINLNQDLINFLKQQWEEKDIQLREKDKQIEELINLNKNNQILLKQQQDKETVSYTHLDVYKRQKLKWNSETYMFHNI